MRGAGSHGTDPQIRAGEQSRGADGTDPVSHPGWAHRRPFGTLRTGGGAQQLRCHRAPVPPSHLSVSPQPSRSRLRQRMQVMLPDPPLRPRCPWVPPRATGRCSPALHHTAHCSGVSTALAGLQAASPPSRATRGRAAMGRACAAPAPAWRAPRPPSFLQPPWPPTPA